MQYGPGAENAYPRVATAYSDGVPMLLLPLHIRSRDRIFPHFSSMESFSSITKYVEQINEAENAVETMRKAFHRLKNGRPGPVMVEIPADLAQEGITDDKLSSYTPAVRALSSADEREITRASELILPSKSPVIYAGQGVIYADAFEELSELAELIQIPVTTTMAGKGAMDERHNLSLGSSSGVMNGAVLHYLKRADTILTLGTSLTEHGMVTAILKGKKIIHATNNPVNIGNYYNPEIALLGDAKLILRQLIESCLDLLSTRPNLESPIDNISGIKEQWRNEWSTKLESRSKTPTPTRSAST